MVPVAHANDGGGSIRIPASICGLVGLKPTRQRDHRGAAVGDNITGLTVELCVTRSVRDTAAILDAVDGSAPGDPYVAPAPLRPYVEELDRRAQAPDRGARASRRSPGSTRTRSASRRSDDAREAARVARPRGRRRTPRSTPELAEALNLEDTSSPAGRPARRRASTSSAMIAGRELTADDVEPLTWALAEIGRERTAGRYLARPRPAPARRPGDRRLVRERVRPAADPDDGRAAGSAGHLRRLAATIRSTPSAAPSRPARSRRCSTPPASRRSRCRCTGPPTAPGRRAARRAVRSRGPADPRRRPARARAAVDRPQAARLRRLTLG